jgi:adenosine deaminase
MSGGYPNEKQDHKPERAVATRDLREHMVASRRTTTSEALPLIADEAFLRAIPKTDIHVHLDGSLRLSTLVELATQQGVKLPSTDEAELRRTVFKPQYESLEEYLRGFAYTTAVMQNAASVERIAFEFAEDNYSEGVRYFEVRFAPQLHASMVADDQFGIGEVIAAVDRGLRRARDAFNHELATVGHAGEPMYEYGMIVCAMRAFFSRNESLLRCLPHSTRA